MELVASEPLVQDPVAIDWDPQGRLWVVEMPGFMPDIAAAREHDPIGRIVVLEDTDGTAAWTAAPCLPTDSCSHAASRCSIRACSWPSRPTSG